MTTFYWKKSTIKIFQMMSGQHPLQFLKVPKKRLKVIGLMMPIATTWLPNSILKDCTYFLPKSRNILKKAFGNCIVITMSHLCMLQP